MLRVNATKSERVVQLSVDRVQLVKGCELCAFVVIVPDFFPI